MCNRLLDRPCRKKSCCLFYHDIYVIKFVLCLICRSKGSVNVVNYSVTKENYGMWTSQDHCYKQGFMIRLMDRGNYKTKYWHFVMIKANFSSWIKTRNSVENSTAGWWPFEVTSHTDPDRVMNIHKLNRKRNRSRLDGMKSKVGRNNCEDTVQIQCWEEKQ